MTIFYCLVILTLYSLFPIVVSLWEIVSISYLFSYGDLNQN